MKTIIALLVLLTAPLAYGQADEIALYDSSGTPVAYVADDLTIYLWSGKPVAYFKGSDIYGFNGRHLGWFEKGYIRDHDGDADCGVKAVISLPKLEPLKSLKELKPLKALPELPPLRPLMSMSWSDAPCKIALAEGAE